MKEIFENRDCMEVMAEYPDKYFDIAIVDPPYGLGASSPTKKKERVLQKNGTFLKVNSPDYGKKDWDKAVPDNTYFKELERVSKKQVIWGGNYFGLSGGCLVWDKLNGSSDQYDAEIAHLSWTKEVRTVYYMWSGMFQGLACSSDIKEALRQQGNKKLNEKRIHPTQKPIKLYMWLLNQYCNTGDKILDTHLGSFSHAIAAERFGVGEFVGCEMDKDHFIDGLNRYKEETAQTVLRWAS
jgi:site-specific DNA-methyltransferase (adenine-specific)